MRKEVIAAMSGGLDSSVVAALLKKAGFEVKGVFFDLADTPGFRGSKVRAKKVARILKIPLSVFNLKREFKKRIIDCFLADYKQGRTPNPCVACNKEIKFGFLFRKFPPKSFFATGHYVRLKDGRLFKGRDKERDQSYFLWQLNQKELRRVLFPVGNYTKEEVRVLAKNFGLPVLKVPESREICFIPKEINGFLKRRLKTAPGKIVDAKGKILGQHQGLWFYTIGQRKGIKLSDGPFFVLGKDLKKNLLIVSKNQKDLFKKELIAKEVNWISGKPSRFPFEAKVKIRYRHKEVLAKLKLINSKRVKVIFRKAQLAVTPGQSVVFYQGEELLGGGIIC
jgi:tRNA-specific 2-thiouridylase